MRHLESIQNLRWDASDDGGHELRDEDTTLARLDDAGAVKLTGSQATTFAVQARGRRTVLVNGRTQVEHASFLPDWSGLGPITLADGTRYDWQRSSWAGGHAEVRTASG